jgi:hypothetical protein
MRCVAVGAALGIEDSILPSLVTVRANLARKNTPGVGCAAEPREWNRQAAGGRKADCQTRERVARMNSRKEETFGP